MLVGGGRPVIVATKPDSVLVGVNEEFWRAAVLTARPCSGRTLRCGGAVCIQSGTPRGRYVEDNLPAATLDRKHAKTLRTGTGSPWRNTIVQLYSSN